MASGTSTSGTSADEDHDGASVFQVDRLLAEAMSTTGLTDIGASSAIEALERLVTSLREEAQLNSAGVAVMRSMIVGLLETRMRALDWAASSDVVEYETIDAPVIVCGLPRTGTTMLSDLLALDPFNRPLLTWEAGAIAPPPTLDGRTGDPRLARALERDRARAAAAPNLAAMHPMAADRATECVQLLAAAFSSLQFETLASLPSYGAWFESADLVDAYRFHHLALRILQTSMPVHRWSLKSPAHFWHLNALRAAYPDARLIVTHRDPAKVVPSVASLVATLRSLGSDARDPVAIGDEWRRKCIHAVTVGAASLAEWPADQVFHLPYAELVDDPVGSVERAYQAFDFDMSDLGRRRMAAWHEQHPRDRHGVHRYDAARFGLSTGALREEFGDYLRAFEVPTED